MDLLEIKAAQDEQNAAWVKTQEVLEGRLKASESREAEFKEKFAKVDVDMAAAETREKTLREEAKAATERMDGLEVALRRPASGAGTEQKSAEVREHEEAFYGWMRGGEEKGLPELEKKVLQTGVLSDGGYRVPTQTEAAILMRVRETSAMRQIATVTSIGGGAWKEHRSTGGTSSGGWVSERATRPATGTPTLGQTEIVPAEQYEMPTVSQEMLDDGDFGVEQWLADEVQLSMAIREATGFITGNGVGKPRGILTYTDGTDDTVGEIEQVFSGHATQITADGYVNLQNALFEVYQPNARFLMRRATWGSTLLLKDGNSVHRLMPDFSAGAGRRLLGQPVDLMADMPAEGAGNLAVAYGDFRQAYRIVDRVGIRVLRDPYSSKPLIQFYTTARVGGGVRNFQAIKIQDCATS